MSSVFFLNIITYRRVINNCDLSKQSEYIICQYKLKIRITDAYFMRWTDFNNNFLNFDLWKWYSYVYTYNYLMFMTFVLLFFTDHNCRYLKNALIYFGWFLNLFSFIRSVCQYDFLLCRYAAVQIILIIVVINRSIL